MLISLIAGLVFIPFIGNCPLFDWDEINFAECAREMVVSGNYSTVQLNFRPFWEKPPLFIWLQAFSMNVFGINEFAARLPNALCSIATLVFLFYAGKKFHGVKFGLLWSFIYASLLLPHIYFKSGIIDPWFNLFVIIALCQFILMANNPFGHSEVKNALFSGVFLGLAVLTKGPAALVVIGLVILFQLLVRRKIELLKARNFYVFTTATVLVSLSWFIFEIAIGNGKIIGEFIEYQIRLFQTEDAGHDGPFFYHAVVLLIGCFPISLLFISGYKNRSGLSPFQTEYRNYMLVLFWVVLILFSIVKTKIVHYSSLCYFPITFIGTSVLMNGFSSLEFRKLVKVIYVLIVVLFSIAFTALCLMDQLKPFLLERGWIQDEFARENLKAFVSWTGFEILLVLLFIAGAVVFYKGIVRQKMVQVIVGLALNMIFIYSAINVFVPKIELITQHSAIEFYKTISTQNCYVETHSYKSYAYLFYSNRLPSDYSNPEQVSEVERMLNDAEREGYSRTQFYANINGYWMKHGNIDRPVYIVAKKHQEHEVLESSDFKKLGDVNGYSFLMRLPAKK